MNRHYFFWIVLTAICGLLLTFYTMWENVKPPLIPTHKSQHPEALAPFKSYISAPGIVEASSENISIGTSLNRIVERVDVKVGENIKKGKILFQLDNQDLKADLQSREVAYEIAIANLKKLESLPRKEDLEVAQGALKKAEIAFNQAKSQFEMVKGLEASRALSLQEINRRRYAFEESEAHFQEAQANYNKIKAGTWKPDIQIAYLEAQQAKTSIDRIQAEIQQTIVRSPIDGKVLQIRIHEGEYPTMAQLKGPLMIIGDTDEKFVKVSINQFDAPYFRSDAPAVAYLRGATRVEYELEFVRLEPFLISKQNLTNEITEKVDTRVLQVVYRIKKSSESIFVGQQMDVFIKAEFPT